MTAPAFKVWAVPDVFLPDGSVRRGPLTQAARFRERRKEVWAEARALAEVATARGSNFTQAEQLRWDLLYAELSYLDVCIAHLSS